MYRQIHHGAKAVPTSPAITPASTAVPGRFSSASATTLGRKCTPTVRP